MSRERPVTQLSNQRSHSTTEYKNQRYSRHDNRPDKTAYEELYDLLMQAKESIFKGLE